MAAKAEIGWVRHTAAGEKIQVFARPVGREWRFFIRQKRFEDWQRVNAPLLEDWMELLDALQRLVVRRRYQPDDVERVQQMILERYPEAKF